MNINLIESEFCWSKAQLVLFLICMLFSYQYVCSALRDKHHKPQLHVPLHIAQLLRSHDGKINEMI